MGHEFRHYQSAYYLNQLNNEVIMLIVSCRSNEQIIDDDVCETHSELCKSLNRMVLDKCFYIGEQRKKLILLRNELEAIIMGESKWNRKFAPSFYFASLLKYDDDMR